MRDHTHTARGSTPTTPNGSTPTGAKLADGQAADHWVLPAEQRNAGYVRPLRYSYVHSTCGAKTTMPQACAETYARQPDFYGQTFCCGCGGYYPVGPQGQFSWSDGTGKVGA